MKGKGKVRVTHRWKHRCSARIFFFSIVFCLLSAVPDSLLCEESEKQVSISKINGLTFGTTIPGVIVGQVVSLVGVGAESNPAIITGGGIIFGSLALFPSLGHYYLGNYLRATLMLLLRSSIASFVFVYPTLRRLDNPQDEDGEPELSDEDIAVQTFFITGLCGAALITLSVVAIRSARREAQRRNMNASTKSAWSFVPFVSPNRSGPPRIGAAVAVEF